MMQRTIVCHPAIFLLFLLLVTIPTSLRAQSTYTNVDGSVYTYTINPDGSASITGYDGAGGGVIIPTNINNLPVTAIGNAAFSFLPDLSSVTIPANVTSIGEYAFVACGLTNLFVPDMVTNIGVYAFGDDSNLIDITIPSSVATIGAFAFESCSGLTNLGIANGVANIQADAFQNCSGLPSVVIPASVTNIGSGAFASCIAMNAIIVAPQNANYISLDGVLFDKSQDTLIQYPGGREGNYIIPSSVTNFGFAFFYAVGLTGLTINDGITSIPGDASGGAFTSCTSLTNITIPDSVTNIGDFAFYGDANLRNVIVPASVTGVVYAFAVCSGLDTVYFLGNAPAQYATFSLSPNVTVYYLPCMQGWSSSYSGAPALPWWQALFGYTTDTDGITITGYSEACGVETVNIPASINGLPVTCIGTNSFYESTSLTSVTISEGVTNIEASAFEGCSNLTNVAIPGSVTTIGSGAFSMCGNLINVIISNGVSSIGDNAFFDCSNLASITIPGTVTNIGEAAFGSCSSLINISFFGDVPNAGPAVFDNDTNATIYYLPCANGWSSFFAGVQTLPWWQALLSFVTNGGALSISGYSGLCDSVNIPASINDIPVTGIMANAFFGATNLTSVTIPAGVTNIGAASFEGCSNLTNVLIPNGVGSIGVSAFEGCSTLRSLSVPPSVITIGTAAFEGCSSLNSFLIPAGVNIIAPAMFERCTSLTNVTIPAGIASIGSNAFEFCSGLRSIVIPGTVSGIGNAAFEACTGLTNLTISAGVTSIGAGTFASCSGLGGILIIPGTVTNIGNEAFDGSYRITDLYFTGNAPLIGFAAFYEIPSAYYLPGSSGWSNNSLGYPFGPSALPWNPQIVANGSGFGISNNAFGFDIIGTNIYTVTVVVCTNLAPPAWTPLQTVTLSNGFFHFRDPQWTNYSDQFYGLSLP